MRLKFRRGDGGSFWGGLLVFLGVWWGDGGEGV